MKFNLFDRKPKKTVLNYRKPLQKRLPLNGSFFKNWFVGGNSIQEDSIDEKAMETIFTDEQSNGTDSHKREHVEGNLSQKSHANDKKR